MSKDFYKIQGLPDFVPDPNPKKSRGNPRATLMIIAIAAAIFIAGMAVLLTYFISEDSSEVEPVTEQNKTQRTTARKETEKEQEQGKMGKIIKATPLLTDENNLFLWILCEKRNRIDNNMYLYNPASEEIIKSIKTEYALDARLKTYALNKKIWVIRDEGTPEIYAYDSETGSELFNPVSFAARYKEFEPGFKYIYFEKSYPGICYKFTVKDGKIYYFDFQAEEFVTESNFRKAAYSSSDYKSTVTVYRLLPEQQSQGRYLLYKVTGPKYAVNAHHISYNYDENGNIKVTNGTAKLLLQEKIFFNGMIILNDKKYIVIVYSNSFDEQSEKMLICTDINGEVLWEKKLSDIQAIEPKGSGNFTSELFEELLVLQDGKTFIAGMNINSGVVKWRLGF